MKYKRVIPRDLFNEAKLLKCVGRLVLMIHDNIAPPTLEYFYNDDELGHPFGIQQDPTDGSIFVDNVVFYIKKEHVKPFTTLNAKSAYPFYVRIDEEEVEIFNENGDFTEEFINACK